MFALLLAATLFSAVPLSDQQALYEGGNNPPADHLAGGMAAAARIRPLDRNGNPSPNGKIVLISIGMSNTTQEFCATGNPAPCDAWSFTGQALADPVVNHSTLAIVNGASGGQDAKTWDSPMDSNYDRVRDNDLAPAGLSEKQVQAAWVKQADASPVKSLPDPNADAYQLETFLGNIARALRVRYPNLQIVYFSSRIYAGYATSTLNPEPYAYESGLAVKWLVQAQIDQMRVAGMVVDSRAGVLRYSEAAPWIAWGPYLWADGMVPRADGLTWARSDFVSDGTHPAASGRQKVGTMLLDFLKATPTAQSWFLTLPRRRATR